MPFQRISSLWEEVQGEQLVHRPMFGHRSEVELSIVPERWRAFVHLGSITGAIPLHLPGPHPTSQCIGPFSDYLLPERGIH